MKNKINNNKQGAGALLLFFVLIISISIICAGLAGATGKQHGISGFVFVSDDGTDPNGANVTFYPQTDPGDRIYDVVGSLGNSRVDFWYSIDISNFKSEWKPGDNIVVEIFKDENHTASALVKMSNFGFDLAPELQLKLPGSNFTDINRNMSFFKGHCGNQVCEKELGETLKTCPLDCRPICGNSKCEEYESRETCCIDCGCKPSICYGQGKCLNNKCVSCCLFGLCYGIKIGFRLCWFWIALAVIIALALFFILRKKKQEYVPTYHPV